MHVEPLLRPPPASSAPSGAAPDMISLQRWRGRRRRRPGAWPARARSAARRRRRVTPCSAISARNWSRSKRGIVTIVAPLRRPRFMITVMPVDVEERQAADQHVVRRRSGTTSSICRTFAIRLRWVSITPFGRPGGAARVRQHGKVRRPDRCRARAPGALGEQLGQGRLVALGLADDDDVARSRHARPPPGRCRGRAAIVNTSFAPGVAELVAELMLRVERVGGRVRGVRPAARRGR